MTNRSIFSLVFSHLVAIAFGFAIGIYVLPILTAPPGPDDETVADISMNREFTGVFARNRQDSDAIHWGEGAISISTDGISFVGKLAPGPDYRLYLSPEFVETEADFNRLKPMMVQVGKIKTFDGFVLPLGKGIDPAKYSSAVVWCEAFGQFITSGIYSRVNSQ